MYCLGILTETKLLQSEASRENQAHRFRVVVLWDALREGHGVDRLATVVRCGLLSSRIYGNCALLRGQLTTWLEGQIWISLE